MSALCRGMQLRGEHELQLEGSRASGHTEALSKANGKLAEASSELQRLTRTNQHLSGQLKQKEAEIEHLGDELLTEQRRRAALEQEPHTVYLLDVPVCMLIALQSVVDSDSTQLTQSQPQQEEYKDRRLLQETLKECRRQLRLKTEESHRLQAELRESSALQLKATHVISDMQAQLDSSPSTYSLTPPNRSPTPQPTTAHSTPMSPGNDFRSPEKFPGILSKDGRLDMSSARKIINYQPQKTYDLDGCDF